VGREEFSHLVRLGISAIVVDQCSDKLVEKEYLYEGVGVEALPGELVKTPMNKGGHPWGQVNGIALVGMAMVFGWA
jgi:hypothetical protein